jgi:hypothetical protein
MIKKASLSQTSIKVHDGEFFIESAIELKNSKLIFDFSQIIHLLWYNFHQNKSKLFYLQKESDYQIAKSLIWQKIN